MLFPLVIDDAQGLTFNVHWHFLTREGVKTEMFGPFSWLIFSKKHMTEALSSISIATAAKFKCASSGRNQLTGDVTSPGDTRVTMFLGKTTRVDSDWFPWLRCHCAFFLSFFFLLQLTSYWWAVCRRDFCVSFVPWRRLLQDTALYPDVNDHPFIIGLVVQPFLFRISWSSYRCRICFVRIYSVLQHRQ